MGLTACGNARSAVRQIAHMGNILVCLLLVCLTLSGCGARIVSFTDKYTRAKIMRMNGNRLAGGITSVELNVQRFEKGDNSSISLIVVYTGPFFLNLEAGNTLTIIMNGARINLFGAGSMGYREHVSLGLVQETAYYHDVDPELLKRIAFAEEVYVEIQTNSKVIRRHFNNNNFNNFRKFYQVLTQIDPTPYE